MAAAAGAEEMKQTRKSRPITMPQWDAGAMGQANRVNLVQEQAGDMDADTGKRVNPNGVKRYRRIDMLEIYYRRGWIGRRQWTAGEVLRNAWEQTERGQASDFSQDRVDSSPKPDIAVTIRIDRLARYFGVSRLIPASDQRILWQVACLGNSIGGLVEYRGSQHAKGKLHLVGALERLAQRLERRKAY